MDLYHPPPPNELDINNERAVHKSNSTPTERLSEMKNFSGLMAFLTNLFINHVLNSNKFKTAN
jgi:hypothetical protein